MEEYDDLSAGPNHLGLLNLSHNTWKILPPELKDFSFTLLHLDLTNNQLTRIDSSIGSLILLKSLNVSLNKLEKIDSAIGKCIRLRRLNIEQNRIESLPDEIGQCILLEEILAKENKLTALPESLVELIAIERIDVRRNDLHSIPLRLSRMPTLQELLCDNNPNLKTAPPNMGGKTSLLLWVLEMQQKYQDGIEPKTSKRNDLHEQSNKLQNEIDAAQRKIVQLENEIAALKKERPDDYILFKSRVMNAVRVVKKWLRRVWKRAGDAFVAWRERRTHPFY